MPSPTAQVVCEILAPDAVVATDLGHIADVCARETGQPLSVQVLPCATGESALTLRLPVELAATQHQVWCLACRLACFCPDTRVSVLILGEAAFRPEPERRSRAHSA